MRSFSTSDVTTNPESLLGYYLSTTQNTSPENIALGKTLINDENRNILQKYFFNETSYTISTVSGQQGYVFPYNYSILKDITVTVGQLRWTPNIILTRTQWDQVNLLPYTSDIPQYFFIYDNKIEIFPIPSTTGNTITFNYKFRVPELSLIDYKDGTANFENGSRIVKGNGTLWQNNYLPGPGSVLNINLWIRPPYPAGDNNWYQVLSIESDSSLTLVSPYQGQSVSSASYSIGQMPVLLEDFHDLLVFKALTTYFSTIQQNATKHDNFEERYNMGIKKMDNYVGEKVVNVDLGTTPQPINPNLFIYKN